MRILTLDNTCIELSSLPDDNDEEIRFAVLDNSKIDDPDFFFEPLMFLESFNAPGALLRIGEHELTAPLDWRVVIGDSNTGNDLEILPITSVYKRDFEAFVYNPLSSFRLDFQPIEILNIYNNICWFFPKTKNNQLLAYPLEAKPKSPCVFFTGEISKHCEKINYTSLV